MPKYRLNALGDTEFESMVQGLLKAVIGAGTITFGAGKDGAREATFEGKAPYPSALMPWSGKWIFQVKFHDTELVGVNRARAIIISDLKDELDSITVKYKYQCDNYIMITNVPLSAVHNSGTIDTIEREVFSKYRAKIPHLAIWGADDVNRLLDKYPEIRTAYLHLLVSGDIIAQLLNLVNAPQTDRAITIDSYLRMIMGREENAQLDQAGDVGEEPILLQKVFFDLDAYVQDLMKPAVERLSGQMRISGLPLSNEDRAPLVWLLINSNLDRIVIVGGPGEGKSTLGQYLAQIHRATLLGRAEEVAMSDDYIPEVPRLPFRVVLRDFAQWLAGRTTDSTDSDSLDSYIAAQIARVSSREFAERDLHEIMRANPTLLVLDGLDEVTDVQVRKRLVARLSEFIEKAHGSLHADVQVVATTRPTGYNDQFDPKTFIHFRLHKLRADQVRGYVQKWASARDLDEAKEQRLSQTIEECLKDHQISLLMTTPLQVTILILIINSGGTPPRQREALFDEYLEVIYKREKAKGLDIVKSEKELLIGLHKYIGYLLQEESTRASTSSAVLPRSTYDHVVLTFLRLHDPYSPEVETRTEWKAITLDAGERLVLIVESPADRFGFELRSIQEFFAACYLSDTAQDTGQRYERFDAIARLPHWRNVALFFAGRVGRNNPGEAANVVEVCRQVDRIGVDIFVRRGAELALELAADRALEPNRVLQRSLLEHGLGIFDSKLSPRTRSALTDVLRRLPPEDIRDHVLPVLNERLTIVGPNGILNICYVLSALAPSSPTLHTALVNLASSPGIMDSADILDVVSDPEVPNNLRVDVIKILQSNGIVSTAIAASLATNPWQAQCAIGFGLMQSDLSEEITVDFADAVTRTTGYLAPSGSDNFTWGSYPDHPLCILLRTAKAVARMVTARHYGNVNEPRRQSGMWARAASDLPEEIRLGTFDSTGAQKGGAWLLWLAHLALGEVSPESWSRYCAWRRSFQFDAQALEIWEYCAESVSPIVALLATVDNEKLDTYREATFTFAGLSGIAEWNKRLAEIHLELERVLTQRERSLLSRFGFGAISNASRQSIKALLDARIDENLQAYAMEVYQDNHPTPELSPDIAHQVLEWFTGLQEGSGWRSEKYAFPIAMSLIRVVSPSSGVMGTFLPILSTFRLGQLATYIASRQPLDSAALRRVIEQIKVATAAAEDDELGVYVRIPQRQIRRILLALIQFVVDEDALLADAASSLIVGVCQSVGGEGSGTAPIRSGLLDTAQIALCASNRRRRRDAGIALYGVRPPRSAADWERIAELLRTASIYEARNLWIWVIPVAAELSSQPEPWIQHTVGVLESGVSEEISVVMSDILRGLLQKQSQSLDVRAVNLGLPRIEK